MAISLAAVMLVGAAGLIVRDRVSDSAGNHAAPATTTQLEASDLPRTCTSNWRRVASPQIEHGRLDAVVEVAPSYAWAVGGVVRLGGDTGGEVLSGSPIVLRWNGERWALAAHPRMRGVLTDVAATSRSDAWAVGYAPPSGAPLVLHWDGLRWSRWALPSSVAATKAVAARSRRDVWTVGTSYVGASPVGEVWHWNGRSWTRALTRRAVLEDVAAVSERDVWVVGSTGADLPKALTLHWDGARWSTFLQGPSPGNDSAWLLAVDAGEETGIWAGGGEHVEELSPPAIGPLMLRWDGARWASVRLPGSGETELEAIAAVSPRDAFAVSSNAWSYYEQGGSGFGIWRFSGGRWRVSDLRYGWELHDVAAAPGRPDSEPIVWSVGQVGSDIEDYATRTLPLICRFVG